MKKALCCVAIAQLRARANHCSELISQLLLGECVDILKKKDNWYYIENRHDGYFAWVDAKQMVVLKDPDFNLEYQAISSSFVHLGTWVSTGAEIRDYTGTSLEGKMPSLSLNQPRISPVKYAKMFLETPYLWGGKSIFGVDCSGYVQLVFKYLGIPMPRDAAQQAMHGVLVSGALEFGDLAFFQNQEGKIVHVGIMLDHQRIIHAHGKVRIDILDEKGIYNADFQRYTHQLHSTRTLL